ncbi:MAG: hypothetical protein L0Z46_06155 [Nitrospiraceae bacterium]|nr:hypothetical protein [Nitrospiraceae bacterium]
MADRRTRHPKAGLQQRTLATPGIDDRHDLEGPPIGQGIMHKIHTLPLGRPLWRGSGHPVQGHMFSPPGSHAQL